MNADKIKRETAITALEKQYEQLALAEIQLDIFNNRLLDMSHGKDRTEMMQKKQKQEQILKEHQLIIRTTKNYIKGLDKE